MHIKQHIITCTFLLVLTVFTSYAQLSIDNEVNVKDINTIEPRTAWTFLSNDANNTFLVDVRTDCEWRWVGTPELPSNTIARKPHYIQESLLVWPDMHLNEQFGQNVYNALKQYPEFSPDKSRIIVMCCCGGRSRKATDLLSSAPYNLNAFSMLYGFSGDSNSNNQRVINGWKVDNLPWTQQ
jgi:rhodanese-related sulfurtransferase